MLNTAAIAALAPLPAALIMTRVEGPGRARALALMALIVSLAAALLSAPGIGRVPMVLFAGLAVAVAVMMPRQDCSPRELARILLLAAGAQTVYAATDPWLLCAGYAAAMLPFVNRTHPLGSALTIASCAAVAGAVMTGSPWMWIAAVALSIGLFPFQASLAALFEGTPLGAAALLFNAHLGAFLLLRLGYATEASWLPAVGTAALVASAVTAVIALVESRPRRILSLVAASQAGFILAGLASDTKESVQGALMQWIVAGLASTGLILVYRLIEIRYGGDMDKREFLGLAERFPRLAVFFAASALALVGLPGTLGFLAEDLLIHGVLQTHPIAGILQPLAAALNAFTLLRLFSTLFLGRKVRGLESVPDAVGRERWPLTALLVLLVIGGLMPAYVTTLDTAATESFMASEAPEWGR